MLNRKLAQVVAGRLKRLIISMPPRHGKSEFVSKYLPVCYLGTWPDRRVMLASYEASFAATWGGKARDVMADVGGEVFGLSVRSDSRATDRWNLDGHEGGMATSGVGGSMTGKGSDLLIIDDPVKNAEEASSGVIRKKHQEWWKSTAYTRLEPGAAAVVMATRWHEDDLSGFLIRQMEAGGETWDVLNLPALAERDDPLGREVGDALWPARYDASRLKVIEQSIGPYWFEALYQGRPTPLTGGMFASFGLVSAVGSDWVFVRYWDKAATDGGGCYTAGVLMARSPRGEYFIVDVIRGQWSSSDREAVIKMTAHLDPVGTQIWVEQEPGSGGVESAENTIKMLEGFPAFCERVTGSKETRARPFSAQAQIGNVKLVHAPWNLAFVEEARLFPNGKYKDQIDAAGGAFNKLALACDMTLTMGDDPFGSDRRW